MEGTAHTHGAEPHNWRVPATPADAYPPSVHVTPEGYGYFLNLNTGKCHARRDCRALTERSDVAYIVVPYLTRVGDDDRCWTLCGLCCGGGSVAGAEEILRP